MKIYKDEIKYIIHDFPDRALKWLLETPENVKGLLLAVVDDLARNIDYSRLQRIDRTFISDNFRKREADLVFIAPFIDDQEDREVIIYILIENQSTVDPTMPFRILSYMLRIWESQREDFESKNISLSQWKFHAILPVVFYTGDQRWEEPLNIKKLIDLPKTLEDFVPQHKTILFNLKTTSPNKLVAYGHPFGWILRIMQKENADTEEFRSLLQLAINHLKSMTPEEHTNWAKLIYFIMAFLYERRGESEHNEFLNIIKNSIDDLSQRKEAEEMSKTMAQVLEARGETRGEARGKVIAKQDDIIRLIRLKFGNVPETLASNIRSVNQMAQLDLIFDNVFKAETIDDIRI